jgi:polysaccharide pyruvyl transferase CsaB
MKLLLSGYYGFDNTGDEAILAATVAGIRQHVPDSEITVLSADAALTSAQHDVRAINRWSMWQQLAAIRRADLFIQGGGGLFQDTTSKLSVLYYMNQLVMARTVRTPFVILAQGVGPLSSSYLRGALVRNFSSARFITVRDAQSAEDLAAWGLRRPEPLVTADPVLLMDPAAEHHTSQLLEALDLSAGRYVLVALRGWAGADEAYDAIVQWLNQQERPVLLLPFQYDRDLPIARHVLGRLKPGSGRVPDAACKPTEVMGLIQAAEEVLAMRLHALIMACAVGTISAGLSYDPKVNAFCRRSGQPVMDLRLVEQGGIEDLMQAARQSRDRVEKNRLQLQQEAVNSFEMLGELCTGLTHRRSRRSPESGPDA